MLNALKLQQRKCYATGFFNAEMSDFLLKTKQLPQVFFKSINKSIQFHLIMDNVQSCKCSRVFVCFLLVRLCRIFVRWRYFGK